VRRSAVARSVLASLHWPVILPAFFLLLFGVVVLGGVEIPVGGDWKGGWDLRQLSGIALGVAAGAVACLVPYKTLVRHAYIVYAGALFLLVVVLVAGTVRNLARRWIVIFGFDFQPSELMKVALILTLARFIRFRSSYKTFKGLGAPFLLTLVPMGLILKQPDLGTALLCVPILFAMLFVAGARARHLLTIVLLGACAMYPVYRWGLHGYQKSRIDGFVAQLPFLRQDKTKDDEKDREDLERRENYQVKHSEIAIGSGGMFGVDAEDNEATALDWVPERHNDFVFAAVGNQWGLFGSTVVLVLLGWLLAATLGVAARQRDPAGSLICVGVFALLGSQAFINIGMTMGVVPVTGMTLPFLSYGRSSVVVTIVAVALVCNVAAHPSYEFGRGDFD